MRKTYRGSEAPGFPMLTYGLVFGTVLLASLGSYGIFSLSDAANASPEIGGMERILGSDPLYEDTAGRYFSLEREP